MRLSVASARYFASGSSRRMMPAPALESIISKSKTTMSLDGWAVAGSEPPTSATTAPGGKSKFPRHDMVLPSACGKRTYSVAPFGAGKGEVLDENAPDGWWDERGMETFSIDDVDRAVRKKEMNEVKGRFIGKRGDGIGGASGVLTRGY